MKKLLLLVWLSFACFLEAEEAGPSVALLGSLSQKLAVGGLSWDTENTAVWSFTVGLRPRFTDGPFQFVADTTWSLPLTASLQAVAPVVSVAEAYGRLSLGDAFDVTFGQKRLALGVGQTLTVGDSLNPTQALFDQKTGYRGLTAEWSPTTWASLSTGISAESGRLDDLTGALQVSLLTAGLQSTVSLVARKDKTFRPAVGATYDLLGLILSAEGAAEFLPQGLRPLGVWGTAKPVGLWEAPTAWNSPAFSGSVAARYELTLSDLNLSVSAEALHAGESWTASETADWKQAVAAATVAQQAPVLGALSALRAPLPVRSQDNAFFRLSAGWAGTLLLSGLLAVDLQDQSAFYQAQVTVTIHDNLDLTLSGLATSGEAGDGWEFVGPTSRDRYQVAVSTTYHF